MATVLSPTAVDEILAPLAAAHEQHALVYPGEPEARQPMHTVYGGAHLFKADIAAKLGRLALSMLEQHAPTPAAFAEVLGIPSALAPAVYERVVAKLEREPVEDFRIDFEDGFGNRPDAEEDETAERAAREVAKGLSAGSLPPFIGIRIKPLNEELKRRSTRTLDIFVSTLLAETGGELPSNFLITLPKVPIAEEVSAFVALLERLEQAHGLAAGALRMELMVELTQSMLVLPQLLRAAKGRCFAAHFGTYDYTASCNITADHQVMDHPSCDFAKQMMKVALAGTGVFLSDGATNVMPSGDTSTIHSAWQLSYRHIRHSLAGGFYQGWDLHPGQLPIRYAAAFSFFLEGLDGATARLKNFIEKAAQATLVGDVFDDAATGQGLLNYFLLALGSGAITMKEIEAVGLTLHEIQTRSFVKILAGRTRR